MTFLEPSPAEVAERDRVEASLRNTAELLTVFRERLIDDGFTTDGAERLCETLFVLMVDG